jgi:SET domain-containing protein
LTAAEFRRRYGVAYARTLRTPRRLPVAFRRACVEFVGPRIEGFTAGRTAPIHVEAVSDAVGRGLFASGDILPGETIGEYAGTLTTRWSPLDHANADFNPYLLRYPFPTPFAIDARNRGNELRFANHADKDWNASRAYALGDGVLRIVFVASRRIFAGEQILIDYGRSYWRALGRSPLELNPTRRDQRRLET